MMCSAGKDGKIVIYTNTTKHVLYLPEFKLPVKDYGNLFEEEIESNLPKMIEVSNTNLGKLLHSLKAHSKNIFTLSAHPTFPNVVLSTCHGGRVVVWDIKEGKPIYCKFQLTVDDQISDSVLSGSFSPNGETFCLADSRGFTYLYGIDSLDPYVAPTQQFYAVDWIMVKEDHHGVLVDEQSQIPSHLVEMGPIMNLQRVPYPNCTPKRIIVDTDEVENEIAYRKEIQKFVVPVLNPIDFEKKAYLKRRKMIYEESDTENVTYDVPDFNQPIIPLPNSSGDEYTGDEDDDDEEDDNMNVDEGEGEGIDENEENEDITPLAVEPELDNGIRLRRRERRGEREARRRAPDNLESNQQSREFRRARRQRQVYEGDSNTPSEVESEDISLRNRRRFRTRRVRPIEVEEDEDPETVAFREQQREERRLRQQERRRQQRENQEREISTQSAEAHPRRRNVIRSNQETEIRRSERARLLRSLHNSQLPSELDRHQRWERRLQRMTLATNENQQTETSNQNSIVRRSSVDETTSSARRNFHQHAVRRPSLDETQMNPPSERARSRRHQSLDETLLAEPIRTRRQTQEQDTRSQRVSGRQRSPDSARESRPKRRVIYGNTLFKLDESDSEDDFEDELVSNKRSREGERRTLPRRESRRAVSSQSIRRSSRLLHSDSNNEEVEQSGSRVIESDTDSEDSLVQPVKKKSKIEPNRTPILEWLSTDKQSWTPYLPQIEDKIVYIKQGHANFVEKTKHTFKSKVDSSLPELLLCHVKEITWTPGNVVTCTITLSIYPALELSETPVDDLPTITVTFFEAENVPDFLILWSEFQESMSRTWDVGDSVVIRYADSTSSGKILAVNETVSQWEKYTVQDEDDDSQITLSPWELCNPNSNFAEIETIPEPELSRIAALLLEKTDDPVFEPFMYQVPYEQYPDYLETIAYPMYISLIQSRLGNNFYRRVQQVAWEWDQMCQNVFAYNAHDSPICDLAREHLVPVKYQILNIPQPQEPVLQRRKPVSKPKKNVVKRRNSESDYDAFDDDTDGEELSDVDISSVSEDFLDEFVVTDSDSD
ncbi:Bromodomain and WD repeat-containing protein 1 [Boothiomyces macroporosus]|uniref:Bromodomain and WD repeat-containing protein 1 n=1 Tax=Boothiomyces macroporosus TaxID=261099 RepID=A0AAD5UH96_9FUNG|nr:Bromodomain and WD repeat-containing protein 1 [Boothiomyces macroporosus]